MYGQLPVLDLRLGNDPLTEPEPGLLTPRKHTSNQPLI